MVEPPAKVFGVKSPEGGSPRDYSLFRMATRCREVGGGNGGSEARNEDTYGLGVGIAAAALEIVFLVLWSASWCGW